MGIEVEGIEEITVAFKKVDLSAKKLSMRSLISAGAEIQRLAIAFAPRETSTLESSIMMTPASDASQPRSANGQFGSWSGTEVTVFVDGDVPVPERQGHTVGDYAYEQETHLAPAGSWKLGPESQAKQDGQAEIVGGAYMERAFDQVTEGGFLDDAMTIALSEIVESLS